MYTKVMEMETTMSRINEISFVTSSNREVWALFKSVSDKETEEEFTRLSQMYCSLK